MRRHFALTVGVMTLMLLTTSAANAQIVTVTNTSYVANPPRANPQGTWSVPAGASWQVVFDYGTVANGTFTPDVNIGVGGTVRINAPNGGTGVWDPIGQENLNGGNPLPAGANVRARLQKLDPNRQWQTEATAYEPLGP
jgi:hypothetical protein